MATLTPKSNPATDPFGTDFIATAADLLALGYDPADFPWILFATDSADLIITEGGIDQICSGGGADKIFAGTGSDIIDSGSGDDLVYGDDATSVIPNSIPPGGNDSVPAADIDLTHDDTIVLATGNDIGYGGWGKDSVWGGDGNDQVGGGAGNDVMSGGAGNDVFAFNFTDTPAVDRITDWDSGDKILLCGQSPDVIKIEFKALDLVTIRGGVVATPDDVVLYLNNGGVIKILNAAVDFGGTGTRVGFIENPNLDNMDRAWYEDFDFSADECVVDCIPVANENCDPAPDCWVVSEGIFG